MGDELEYLISLLSVTGRCCRGGDDDLIKATINSLHTGGNQAGVQWCKNETKENDKQPFLVLMVVLVIVDLVSDCGKAVVHRLPC